MYTTQANVTTAIIAKPMAAHGLSVGTKVTTLPEGQVALVNSGMRVIANLAAVAASETFYIVQGMGVGTPALKSQPLVGGSYSLSGLVYSEPSQQITYVGYNGSSGAIDADDSATAYQITIKHQNNDENNRSFPIARYGMFKTGGTASNIVSTTGLIKNLIKQYLQEPQVMAKFERVVSGTVADTSGTGTLMKFTKGSKVVTFHTADDADLPASTGTVTDGDVISVPSSEVKSYTFTALTTTDTDVYIGDTLYDVAGAASAALEATAIAAAVNAGTQAWATVATAAVTITPRPGIKFSAPVVVTDAGGTPALAAVIENAVGDRQSSAYIVYGTTSAAASFVLDVTYQGETTYVVGGIYTKGTNSNGGVIGTPGNWGIRLVGVAQPFDVMKWRNYSTNRFTVAIGTEFNATPITTGSHASEGIGAIPQARQMEFETWGFQGQGLGGTPPEIRNSISLESDTRFSVLNFRQENEVGSNVQSSKLGTNVIVYLGIVNPDDSGVGTVSDVSANGESIVGSVTTYDFA
tara:strand:- start:1188 stop:2756 length:1569 start_codon:yes stop_codon:yes gene_type:complete